MIGTLYPFVVRESVISSLPVSLKSWLGADLADVLLSFAMLRSPGMFCHPVQHG
jgi:hypothetical protein